MKTNITIFNSLNNKLSNINFSNPVSGFNNFNSLNNKLSNINFSKTVSGSNNFSTKQISNVKKYLFGNNTKLTGTILRVSKVYKKSKPYVLSYAILLYFDHRTGRIERYLWNPNVDLLNKNLKDKNNLLMNDPDLLKLYQDSLNYKNYITENILEKFFIDTIDLGVLNRKFYNLFLYELIKDYISKDVNNRKSYLNPDMNLIKLLNHDTHINYLPSRSDHQHLSDNYLIKEINTQNYIENNPTEKHIIYVPINFSIGIIQLNKKLKSLYNIEVVKASTSMYPECITDIKKIINFNNINSLEDLKNLVIKCNDEIKDKINSLV